MAQRHCWRQVGVSAKQQQQQQRWVEAAAAEAVLAVAVWHDAAEAVPVTWMEAEAVVMAMLRPRAVLLVRLATTAVAGPYSQHSEEGQHDQEPEAPSCQLVAAEATGEACPWAGHSPGGSELRAAEHPAHSEAADSAIVAGPAEAASVGVG